MLFRRRPSEFADFFFFDCQKDREKNIRLFCSLVTQFLTFWSESVSENNRIKQTVTWRREKAASKKLCCRPRPDSTEKKLNGKVDQELINGNHWRHIAMCTRHRSDNGSSVSHDEIEIYLVRIRDSWVGTHLTLLTALFEHRKYLFFRWWCNNRIREK